MRDPIPLEALLAGYPEPMASLGEHLRRVVRSAVPESIERVRTGWRLIGYDLAVGRRTVYLAWIMPETTHVHLGFPKGILLDDPAGVLHGAGITKAARWFTLRQPDDVPVELLASFVRSATEVARLGAPEQVARRLDREATAQSAAATRPPHDGSPRPA